MTFKGMLIGAAFFLAACAPKAVPPPTPSPALLPLPQRTPRATATPARVAPTPVIIASPTPTATPVTHVVEEGETLIGIAVQYGVSLESLQMANPGVQPQFLSIGTVLVIPFSEDTALVLPAAVTPVAVELGDPACYPLPTTGLYCFVEARNPGQAPLENVSARITLAGADGLPLVSGVAFAALDVIPVGQSAPLGVLFQPAPAAPVAATGIEILTANWTSGASAPSVALQVVADSGALGAGRWTVTGVVRNPSPLPASAVRLALTLYDGDGHVVGYRTHSLSAPLEPGESLSFSVWAVPLAGAVAHFTVLAVGTAPLAEGRLSPGGMFQ